MSEYEALGWDVSTDAPVDLPGIPHQFRADVLARREDETVVVEVKAPRQGRDDTRLRDLAEVIDRTPGWRLRVVVLPDDKPPAETEVLSQRLLSAKSLLDTDPQSALVLAWAAAEGHLAQRAAAAEVSTRRVGLQLLAELYDNDLLDDEEFGLLQETYAMRNAAAHGRMVADVRPSTVRLLAWLESHMQLRRPRPDGKPGGAGPTAPSLPVVQSLELQKQIDRLTSFSPKFAPQVLRLIRGLVELGYEPKLPQASGARLPSYISFIDKADGRNLGNLNSQTFYLMRRELREPLASSRHFGADSRYAHCRLISDDAVDAVLGVAAREKK